MEQIAKPPPYDTVPDWFQHSDHEPVVPDPGSDNGRPPDEDVARAFLGRLDPEAEAFCFQVLPDKPGALPQTLHGPFDELAPELEQHNRAGAGIFVCVNETDGRARKAENITRIRATFADLDGSPLETVMACGLEPSLVIESSPGRFHAYWFCDGLPLDQFEGVQRTIAQRFGADPACVDLPRVLRLPGFWHMKNPEKPFLSTIIYDSGAQPYSADQILAEFPPLHGPQGSGRAERIKKTERGDPILVALFERHLVISRREDSGYNIQCPFDHEHTAKSGETSTVYFPAHTGGFPSPKFQCMHAHCANRTMDDYKQALGIATRPNGGGPGISSDYVNNAACGDEHAKEQKPLELPKIPDVPEFPLDILPKDLQGWIGDAAERAQFSPDFAAAASMVGLGNLSGRKLGIRLKRRDDWTEYANVWGMLVGLPSALKSPAMREALRPLKALQTKADEEYHKEFARFKQDLIGFKLREKASLNEAKKKLSKDLKADINLPNEVEPEEPIPRCYWTSNVTAEKLGVLLAQNPNGLLIERDELSSFLASLDEEQNATARGLYLSGWSGKEGYRFDRIIRGTTCLPKYALSLVGGIQPGPLQRYVRQAFSGDRADGLLQRLQMSVWPDQGSFKYVDRYPDGNARRIVTALFQRVDEFEGSSIGRQDEFGDNPPYIHLSNAAQEIFIDWYENFMRQCRTAENENGASALDCHFGKYPGLVGKLALVIHLADDPAGSQVSDVTILKALGWIDYLTPHAKRIYHAAENPETGAASLLLARLKRGELQGGFKPRDVYRKKWHGLTDTKAVRKACYLLHDFNWLGVIETERQAGRPADPVFFLTEAAKRMLGT